MERWRSKLHEEIVAAVRKIGHPASAQEICDVIEGETGQTPRVGQVIRQLKRGPFKTSRRGWVLNLPHDRS